MVHEQILFDEKLFKEKSNKRIQMFLTILFRIMFYSNMKIISSNFLMSITQMYECHKAERKISDHILNEIIACGSFQTFPSFVFNLMRRQLLNECDSYMYNGIRVFSNQAHGESGHGVAVLFSFHFSMEISLQIFYYSNFVSCSTFSEYSNFSTLV